MLQRQSSGQLQHALQHLGLERLAVQRLAGGDRTISAG
jgi:hypothetical protein